MPALGAGDSGFESQHSDTFCTVNMVIFLRTCSQTADFWYTHRMNKHVKSFGVIIALGITIIILAAIWSAFRNGEAILLLPQNATNETIQDSSSASNNPESATGQNSPYQSGVATPNNLSDGQTVLLPMTITGMVPGNWFFEGSFPVFMKDQGGVPIAVALAQTTADWMTTDMIPFTVVLPVVSYTGPGTIVFQKDNPSGEPQFDASVTVNVVFQ